MSDDCAQEPDGELLEWLEQQQKCSREPSVACVDPPNLTFVTAMCICFLAAQAKCIPVLETNINVSYLKITQQFKLLFYPISCKL
jgi:hypothetical protein